VIARPELFKLTKITHEERLENLFVLLSDSNNIATASSASVVDLPTDDDVLKVISSAEVANNIPEDIIQLNEMRIIVWNLGESVKWFVGYVKEKSDKNYYVVEHLERAIQKQDVQWRYHTPDDTQVVEKDQIMSCKVEGDWDFTTNTRIMKYMLKNVLLIKNAFKKLLTK